MSRTEPSKDVSLLLQQSLRSLGTRITNDILECDNDNCQNRSQCRAISIEGIPYAVCTGVARDKSLTDSLAAAIIADGVREVIETLQSYDALRTIEVAVKAQRGKLAKTGVKNASTAESLLIKTINNAPYLYCQRWENGTVKNTCVCPLHKDFTPKPKEKYLKRLKSLDVSKMTLSTQVEEHFTKILALPKADKRRIKKIFSR